MSTLKQLQDILNSDKAEQSKFMADPSKYLQESGLVISDETMRQVEALKGTRTDGAAPVLSVGLIRPIIFA